MRPLLLSLALLASTQAHAAPPERKVKVDGYEFTTETLEGADARKLFRVLLKAGFPVTVTGNESLLLTSAISCYYHDPERDGHWVTEHCRAGESAAVGSDTALKIAPKIVNVSSFPNEKEVYTTLPGGYTASDMGRGILAWEKVACRMSITAVCEVTYRSDL